MKKLIALLLVAVLAVVAFGCTQTSAPSTPTQAPTQAPTATTPAPDNPDTQEEEELVNVIYMGPLSGVYASYGVLTRAGCEEFVMFWEQQGGFKNFPNRKLNVTYEDNEGNADVAMAMFERLAESADAFLFSTTTATTIACQPLALKYEKPCMLLAIVADRAMEQNNKFTFRATAGDKDIAVNHDKLLDFLEAHQGFSFETFVSVHGSDDYGLSASAQWIRIMEAHGSKMLAEETIQTSATTDVSGVINKIKRVKPDVILVSLSTVEAGLFQKGLKEYQCDVPILSSGSGYGDPAFFENIGPGGSDGVVSSQTWIPDCIKYCGDPEQAQYWYDNALDLTGQTFTEQQALAWCAIASLVEALDRAETLDGNDIVEALLATDLPYEHWANWFTLYEGIKYDFKNDRYNQNIYASCIYGQVHEDNWKLIFLPGTELDNNPLEWPIKGYA
jgi:branched-chain amino acid transport system substrate-binding protein